jgi:hypothetical protein
MTKIEYLMQYNLNYFTFTSFEMPSSSATSVTAKPMPLSYAAVVAKPVAKPVAKGGAKAKPIAAVVSGKPIASVVSGKPAVDAVVVPVNASKGRVLNPDAKSFVMPVVPVNAAGVAAAANAVGVAAAKAVKDAAEVAAAAEAVRDAAEVAAAAKAVKDAAGVAAAKAAEVTAAANAVEVAAAKAAAKAAEVTAAAKAAEDAAAKATEDAAAKVAGVAAVVDAVIANVKVFEASIKAFAEQAAVNAAVKAAAEEANDKVAKAAASAANSGIVLPVWLCTLLTILSSVKDGGFNMSGTFGNCDIDTNHNGSFIYSDELDTSKKRQEQMKYEWLLLNLRDAINYELKQFWKPDNKTAAPSNMYFNLYHIFICTNKGNPCIAVVCYTKEINSNVKKVKHTFIIDTVTSDILTQKSDPDTSDPLRIRNVSVSSSKDVSDSLIAIFNGLKAEGRTRKLMSHGSVQYSCLPKTPVLSSFPDIGRVHSQDACIVVTTNFEKNAEDTERLSFMKSLRELADGFTELARNLTELKITTDTIDKKTI